MERRELNFFFYTNKMEYLEEYFELFFQTYKPTFYFVKVNYYFAIDELLPYSTIFNMEKARPWFVILFKRKQALV